MNTGSFRRVVCAALVVAGALVVPPLASAAPCVSSCAHGRRVCFMQAYTAFTACLQSCAAGDTQCSAACRSTSRAARATCQATQTDCATTCPPASSGTDSCTTGCSATAKASFAQALAAGKSCVRGCAASADVQSCLKQCAATMSDSAAPALATFQGCLSGCQGPVTGVCYSTTAMECTTDPCGPGQACSQPNEFCSERCASPAPSGTCYDSSTLQCTGQTCSPTQPCAQASQTCVPTCPPPTPHGKCFDTSTKQCTDQACGPGRPCASASQVCTLQCQPPPPEGTCFDTTAMQCTDQACSDGQPCSANQRCVRQCPPPTPVPQCSSVPCGGPCVVSAVCSSGESCRDSRRQYGQCVSDANGNCGCLPASPRPTPTARATPTPQCQAVPCGGSCTIGPFCEPGEPCPAFPTRLGQCIADATGVCQCGPLSPTPTPSPLPPQCSDAPCGGSCSVCSHCDPGEVCPDFCRPGTCQTDASGACQCVPVQLPTPTARPTCASDADCDDGNVCTADHCDGGKCEHACICATASGTPTCCTRPGELCVHPCGTDATGACGGFCPFRATCAVQPTAQAGCGCVSGAGGPCGGNLFVPPPVCAAGLVCQQHVPDAIGVCVVPNCIPLSASGCTQTSDCCVPCGNGTHAPCAVCLNGTCVGAP